MRQLYDGAGQVVANTRYDPFGSVLSSEGTATSHWFRVKQHSIWRFTYVS